MDNKKVFFTYVRNETGKISLNRVCIVDPTTNKITQEKFDIEKHGEMFKNFLSNSNIGGETLVSELEEKGLFNENEITAEKIETYITSDNTFTIEEEKKEEEVPSEEYSENDDKNVVDNTEFDSEDEYVESDEKKDNVVVKRAVAGILATGAVVGTLALLHSCENEQIVEETQNQTLEDLLNQMTPEQKAFFESSFRTVETFNNNAVKEGNFALEKDQSTLHMTVDEAIALNIILNNYSSDDLYDIFGTVEFDTTNIMNLSRSAYGKLSTYYMNAKEASGLSKMIEDETAREFFERHENAVIEFNNNPTIELSDNVIKGLYYDYTVNGSNGEYAKINNDGVAWLATSAEFGFELANRNVEEFLRINAVSEEEKLEYGSAVATVGLTLNKVTTSELLSGINEEINVDIMDELDNKSLCASVTAQTKDKVDALTMKQNIASTIIETNAKDELVEGLRENGNISLANKVLASDITPELLKEISQVNSKANELVDEYNSRINSLTEKEAKIMAIINLAQEKYNSKEEINLADLVNNRFRSPLVVEKEPVVDTTPGVTTEEEKKEQLREDLYVGKDEDGTPVYDGDKLAELPKEEQEEFIKDNGVIVEQETTVTEKEEVKLEDLTPVEQEKVIDEEAVLREIETLRNDLITQGVYDAIDYTEEIGAYNYNGKIVIPYNNQELDTNSMSLFNIAAYDAAFGGNGIDDNQIQSRMNSDVAKLANELSSLSSDARAYLEDKYGSNWESYFIEETYVYGYTEQINSSLAEAVSLGSQIRQMAEDEYNKAQAELDRKNQFEEDVTVQQPTTNESEIETPGNYVPEDETTNGYDPNLDQNYGMEDEQPYVPNVSIETPGNYVSEEIPEDYSYVETSGDYVPEESIEITQESTNEYDPNLDQNYSMPDEQPYIPSFSIETPGYYVSNAELEDAFNKVVSEETPGKSK